MARTVGDTQLPTNVPPVNAPNGRHLSVTLPRCAAAFAIAPPPAGRHGGGCPSTKHQGVMGGAELLNVADEQSAENCAPDRR